ncbi:hypothetical protein R6Q57_020292 [Mikania cordata]
MEGGSSRGVSSNKKFRKPRPKNLQTPQMNPFNTPGYRPHMPNQNNFYYEQMNPSEYLQYSPDTQQQFNQDYRDHTQDDSDSSNHNKSVQVESEEEEPIRPMEKKAIRKKAPAKRWTDEEEVALAKSWLTISENLDVTDHFHQLMKDNSRTLDQIYSKWNDLNSVMKKWNGFYQQALMNRKSGEGDEHVLKKAMKDYKSEVKSKGFPHMQAWELVHYNSL